MTHWVKLISRSVLLCALGLISFSAKAEFPDKQITFIYPYAAGSAADIAWRLLDQEVGRLLGVTVVHLNQPGAGGRTGVQAVMAAPPNGYTIGMLNNVVGVWQPLMNKRFQIEPGKNYTPIVYGIETPLMLIARQDAPFKDLAGLIKYAKENPGKVTASSAGIGSGGHLGVEMLKLRAGIALTHVPFTGQAPALQNLLSGSVDIGFMDSPGKEHVDSGRLLGLAVGAKERWKFMPNLPTLDELGLKGFDNSSWNGVVAPPGMPPDVVLKLNSAFNEVLKNPQVREKLEAAGWTVRGGTPEQFAEIIKRDTEIYEPVIRAGNITLE